VRTAHFAAFETAVGVSVPALASHTFDGDVPIDGGKVRRETYLVLHDMGFDSQDDGRLAAPMQDPSDGQYRVVVRIVATTRAGVRATADVVKAGLVGTVLVVAGRTCGAIFVEPGPRPVERDDEIDPPLFYLDMDFLFRSQRA